MALRFFNGSHVVYQGAPFRVLGRSEDGTYTLGTQMDDGQTWVVQHWAVPEADLQPVSAEDIAVEAAAGSRHDVITVKESATMKPG